MLTGCLVTGFEQVHVETAVATADFPNSPVRPAPSAPPAFDRHDRNAPSYDDDHHELGRTPFGRTQSGGSDHIVMPTLNVNGTSDDGLDLYDDSDDSIKAGKYSNDSKVQLK